MNLYDGIYNKESMLVKEKIFHEEIFDEIDKAFNNIKLNEDGNDLEYINRVKNNFNAIINEALNGNIAMQDYVGSIFSKGYLSLIEPNIYIATCWSLYAGSNGSKRSLERINSLLQPAVDYVQNHTDRITLFDTYNLTDKTYDCFLSSHVANVLVYILGLNENTLQKMTNNPSKYEEDRILEIGNIRDDNLDAIVDYLGL